MQTITTPEQRGRLEKVGWKLEEHHRTIHDHYEFWAKLHNGDRGRSDVTLHAMGKAPKWAETCLLEDAVEFATIRGVSPQGYVLVPADVAKRGVYAVEWASVTATARSAETASEPDRKVYKGYAADLQALSAALQQGTVLPPSQSGGADRD